MKNYSRFLCFCLGALIFVATPALAKNETHVKRLTEENIRQFLNDVQMMSTGEQAYDQPDTVAAFFKNHIAEKAYFESNIRMEIPGMSASEQKMVLDKNKYISGLLAGQNIMDTYDVSIDIENLEIAGNRRTATLDVTTRETGIMPWGEENGEAKTIPVIGQSKCEEKIIISLHNYIQLAKAVCETTIKLDPFGGKPLGAP